MAKCTDCGFSTEDTRAILQAAVPSVLTDVAFHSSDANELSSNIISAALKGLQSLNRPFKYAITVVLMQKNGAGLVSAASTFWDPKVDGYCSVLWENKTIQCIVTVYGACVNVPSVDDQDQGDGKDL